MKQLMEIWKIVWCLLFTIRRAVWDADGTLWNFWFYFCPFGEKVLKYLAKSFNVKVEEVERELGRVYKEFGTHEPIAPLLFTSFRKNWQGKDYEFYEICERYDEMLEQSRRENLKAYPGAPETLEALYQRHVNNWILSDGGMHNVLKKLNFLGIIHLFSGVVAVRPEAPPDHLFFTEGDREYYHRQLAQAEAFIESWRRRGLILHEVDKADQKPGTVGINFILHTGDDGRQLAKPYPAHRVILTGDNPGKDLGVAVAVGIRRALWASYGLIVPPAYINLIDVRLTPDGVIRTDGHGISHVPTVIPPYMDRLACVGEVLKWIGFRFIGREPRAINANAFSGVVTNPDD